MPLNERNGSGILRKIDADVAAGNAPEIGKESKLSGDWAAADTVGAVLERWRRALAGAGVEDAGWESALMYSELSGIRHTELQRAAAAAPEVVARGEQWVARRLRREPLQYIMGHAPFMDFELEVTPEVLIPRPETELLAEDLIRDLPRGGRLLDVGTGSGAIALSVAYARPDVTVLALEISTAALEVAARNRTRYGLDQRVTLRRSDLLAAVEEGERFDFLAANLPYIAEEEYAGLQPEVRDFEPKLALTAPEGGLGLILELARQAPPHLKPGAGLMFEIGWRQGKTLADALRRMGYCDVTVRRDYAGLDRFVRCVR